MKRSLCLLLIFAMMMPNFAMCVSAEETQPALETVQSIAELETAEGSAAASETAIAETEAEMTTEPVPQTTVAETAAETTAEVTVPLEETAAAAETVEETTAEAETVEETTAAAEEESISDEAEMAAEGIAIDAAHFPDAIFRSYLSTNFDTDKNGVFSQEELTEVCFVDVGNMGIADLTGVEYLTELLQLTCDRNQLTSLDLRKNTNLSGLDCRSNSLTVLNLPQNTNMVSLLCTSNQLSSLDVSQYSGLKQLHCGYNQISVLDLSRMTDLYEFTCNDNQLTKLDVTNLPELIYFECGENKLTQLDISQNTKLTRLDCSGNQITSLDVTKHTALEYLSCSNNPMSSLDVSCNLALEQLYCNWVPLTSLDVSKNLLLEELQCNRGQLTQLDVSKNTALIHLRCGENQLKTLDVTKNTNLMTLECEYNQLTVLDVTQNPELCWFNCSYNQLTDLDISNNLKLYELWCDNNPLGELDVSNHTALGRLFCWNTQISELDLSKHTLLRELNCGDNQIRELDLRNCADMWILNCYGNLLQTLDVKNHPKLITLWCFNNPLTSLDLSGNPAVVNDFAHWNSHNKYEMVLDKKGTFDLSSLPAGFDLSKASNWRGGTVKGMTLTVNPGEYEVYYTYDCGSGLSADFVLYTANAPEPEETEPPETEPPETTAPPAREELDAPKLEVSNRASDGKPSLSWNKVSGAKEYQVYRSTSKSGSFKRITTTDNTSFVNTSTTAGKTYYYKVRAVAADGEKSEYSKVVSRICKLPQPDLDSYSLADTGKIKLHWKKVEGAVKYEIYRATSKNGEFSRLGSTKNLYYTNSKITAGKTYYYKIKAVPENEDAASAFSNRIYRTCDLPRPEISLSTVDSSGKIKVSWKAISGAEKYEVYRATSEKGEYSKISTTTNTSATDTKAVAGTKYYYKVKAIHDTSAANSAYSTVKSATCDLACPGIGFTNDSKTGYSRIMWAAVEGASKYEVYCATSKSGKYSLLWSTSEYVAYNHANAELGKTYYYKVRAVHKNSAANSAYSDIVSGARKLGQPQVTSIGSDASTGNILLKWKAVENAAYYRVYRSTSKNGTYKCVEETKGLKFLDWDGKTGKTYYYKVRAFNKTSGVNSAYSEIKDWVDRLPAPQLHYRGSSTGNPSLHWKAITGATGYEVYRSTKKDSGYVKIKVTCKTEKEDGKQYYYFVDDTNNTDGTRKKAGTTYYYKVRAIHDVDRADSWYSEPYSTLQRLAVPTVTKSITIALNIKLSWKKVQDAKKYEVYRKRYGDSEYKLWKTTTSTSVTDRNHGDTLPVSYYVVAVHKNAMANSCSKTITVSSLKR